MKIFCLPMLILAAFMFVLLGCGQKGALYLPEKQSPPKIEAESTPAEVNNKTQPITTKEQPATKNTTSPNKAEGGNK